MELILLDDSFAIIADVVILIPLEKSFIKHEPASMSRGDVRGVSYILLFIYIKLLEVKKGCLNVEMKLFKN